jgi:8-oxo-dGTP diphosphatase
MNDKWKILVNATIIKDGKILFGKRIDIKKWELPGGKLEAGEQPTDAIKRELKEELDLDIEIKKLLICYVVTIVENGKKIHILHINYLVYPKTTPKINNECHEELKWFEINELRKILKDKNEMKKFCLGTDKVIFSDEICQT